ncbi:MAG: FAD-binding oxidoreductase [Gammaproteobacteria bacterium]|nr:FAD-binding oxidoreductase [Gammaproteobacteria bacterium]NCW56450.1 FAD-binding oxidoreductase [Gammaproteobacteria bacterium]NDA43198.1 FAD-binding oxidoreductase [Gammaproteobacteria bacterium]
MSAHVDSWYAASAAADAAARPPRPTLTGHLEVDVCVVGGGIAGCSTALHLAERGYRVALLEAEVIGWGASGRSGAQAITGVACGQSKLESLVGADDARRIWDMSVEALALQRELIQKYAIDCDYVAGQMHVALKPRQERELREEVAMLERRYDYRSVRMVERDEVRTLIDSDRYIAGTFDPLCGHLHPLKYTQGLAAAAERLGVNVFEHSRVLGYTRSSTAHLHVRTAEGEIRCRQLALCGNAWLGPTAPALARKIIGVGTYIVATQVLGAERAAALIRNNAAVTDVNWVIDYFRRSADHRLLFGGRVSYSGVDPLGTRRATRARMLKVFPQLADADVDYAWGGLVDITLNRAPHFGTLERDVYFVQGFSGHGIALTGIAGKLLAEAISGQSERFDIFGRIRHRDFPGGDALRRPALVLAMLWYRLRDLL